VSRFANTELEQRGRAVAEWLEVIAGRLQRAAEDIRVAVGPNVETEDSFKTIIAGAVAQVDHQWGRMPTVLQHIEQLID
jgi:hypothetical protein